MIKKQTMALLTVIAVCTAASGCSTGTAPAEGTTSPAGSTGANSNKTGEKIVLTMWGGVPAESGPQAVVDAWNAKNPDIQVKYERFVNDDAGNMKLDTALATDQGVDLFVNYSQTQLQRRIDAGFTLDLGTFTDYNIDEKINGAGEWKINSKYYAMPTSKSQFFVWFNKEMLDQAGLKIPESWTWQEMKTYAEKLKSDKRYGLVQHLEPFPDPLDSVSVKYGYTKPDGSSNMDHALYGQWLETLKSMMQDGRTTVPYAEQVTSKMPVDTVFLKGEAAMLNAGTWIFRSSNNMKDNPRSFKIAFAPVPRLAEKAEDFVTRGGTGDAISINAKSKNREAAWKFLKWYADGGMLPMVPGGRFPASKAVNADETIKLLLGDNAATYDQESLKKVLFQNIPTYTRSLPKQVLDLRQEEYESFFTGKKDLKATLDAIAKRHNDYLKQNKK
ncbi:carbohydrate ABC transporter substrate-binding protein [Paenibacillus sp. H1-7]|uniref:ABC transporter substrate-binding protein n=1 Tax=Paenibacillus sp. H1-7 TaxID=2282849 RepID=UPI001EF88352|nr:ABC transporter substrate-binding protein [Paenibacillus sp. H1-7]ULL16335.1 carbohydrate ABC transporter substrate-binding protein [Paenibacillus sp. H1-7]